MNRVVQVFVFLLSLCVLESAWAGNPLDRKELVFKKALIDRYTGDAGGYRVDPWSPGFLSGKREQKNCVTFEEGGLALIQSRCTACSNVPDGTKDQVLLRYGTPLIFSAMPGATDEHAQAKAVATGYLSPELTTPVQITMVLTCDGSAVSKPDRLAKILARGFDPVGTNSGSSGGGKQNVPAK